MTKKIDINKIVNKDAIIKQSKANAINFDIHYSEATDDIFKEITGIIVILNNIRSQVKLNELENICYSILKTSLKSIYASLELLRNGYKLQPGIIIRQAIESQCVSLFLKKYPKKLSLYRTDELLKDEVIVAAFGIVPCFGRHYNFFLQLYRGLIELHQNDNEHLSNLKNDNTVLLNLHFIRLSVWMLIIAIENVFFEYLPKKRYWVKCKKGYVYRPNKDEQIWMEKFIGDT